MSLSLPAASGTVEVLSRVDLSVAAGETVALTGASGSGKTSLLMIAAGLEPATSGRIAVAGVEMTGKNDDERARLRLQSIGIVFQSFHLVPTMSALENVVLPLELADRADPWKIAETALGEVGLAHRLTHLPSELSGGEQQRVALARALVMRPKLLLADEPTGNLDAKTGAQVVDLLFARRAETGATLVLVTHDPALAARCDRIVSLSDGRIVGDNRATAA